MKTTEFFKLCHGYSFKYLLTIGIINLFYSLILRQLYKRNLEILKEYLNYKIEQIPDSLGSRNTFHSNNTNNQYTPAPKINERNLPCNTTIQDLKEKEDYQELCRVRDNEKKLVAGTQIDNYVIAAIESRRGSDQSNVSSDIHASKMSIHSRIINSNGDYDRSYHDVDDDLPKSGMKRTKSDEPKINLSTSPRKTKSMVHRKNSLQNHNFIYRNSKYNNTNQNNNLAELRPSIKRRKLPSPTILSSNSNSNSRYQSHKNVTFAASIDRDQSLPEDVSLSRSSEFNLNHDIVLISHFE